MAKKSRARRQVVAHYERQELTKGPIPTPDHFERYEQTLPGAAERILAMAERQSEHRQGLEAKVIKSDIFNSRLGLIFGFIVGMSGIASAFYLIYSGMVLEGTIFGGATVVSLVGVFIYGSRQRRIERQSKPR